MGTGQCLFNERQDQNSDCYRDKMNAYVVYRANEEDITYTHDHFIN